MFMLQGDMVKRFSRVKNHRQRAMYTCTFLLFLTHGSLKAHQPRESVAEHAVTDSIMRTTLRQKLEVAQAQGKRVVIRRALMQSKDVIAIQDQQAFSHELMASAINNVPVVIKVSRADDRDAEELEEAFKQLSDETPNVQFMSIDDQKNAWLQTMLKEKLNLTKAIELPFFLFVRQGKLILPLVQADGGEKEALKKQLQAYIKRIF